MSRTTHSAMVNNQIDAVDLANLGRKEANASHAKDQPTACLKCGEPDDAFCRCDLEIKRPGESAHWNQAAQFLPSKRGLFSVANKFDTLSNAKMPTKQPLQRRAQKMRYFVFDDGGRACDYRGMVKAKTSRRRPRNLSLSDDCIRKIDAIATADGIATRSGTVSDIIRRESVKRGIKP